VGCDEAVVILTHALFDERHYLRYRLGGWLGLTLQLLQFFCTHEVGVEGLVRVHLTLERLFLQDLDRSSVVGNLDKSGPNGHQLVAAQFGTRGAHYQADDVRWELELEARLLRHVHLCPTQQHLPSHMQTLGLGASMHQQDHHDQPKPQNLSPRPKQDQQDQQRNREHI